MNGRKDNNKGDCTFQTVLLIAAVIAGVMVLYGICCFVSWCVDTLRQLFVYMGGVMGMIRLVTLLGGLVLAGLAMVVCEQWASRLFSSLTWGLASVHIAACFVDSLDSLPQAFWLGVALYCGSIILLPVLKRYLDDLQEDTTQVNEQNEQ